VDKKTSKLSWKVYLIAALSILILIVMLQNTGLVYLRFLFFGFRAPLVLLIVMALSVGFGVGYLFARRRLKKAA
jgi:uncharacterized integral membrane protein